MGDKYGEMVSNEDYEVGYGKPPTKHRFKKGKSGNPRGRPRKTKDFRKLADQVLDQPVVILEGGKRVTVTIRQAIVKQLAHDALKGNARARQELIKLAGNYQDPDTFEVDAQDEALLERYIQQAQQENLIDESQDTPD